MESFKGAFKQNPLLTKSTVAIVGTTCLILAVVGGGVWWRLDSEYRSKIVTARDAIESAALEAVTSSLALGRPDMERRRILELFARSPFCGARIKDSEGGLVDVVIPVTDAGRVAMKAGLQARTAYRAELIPGRTIEICREPVVRLTSEPGAIGWLALIMLSGMGATAAAVWRSTRIFTIPFGRLRVAMQEFMTSQKQISDPQLLRNDEVGRLSQSLNVMAISLSESYRTLKKAKEDAGEAYRVKTDFFANMTHELRTPLNSVIGMTQLLMGSKLDDEQKEMFDSIKRSGENLLKIVNDILDISKMEAKQVELEYTPFDVFQEVRHLVTSMQPIAAQKNLALFLEMAAGRLAVVGDPLRFTRIATNLVSNAIRYTETGSVRVYVSTLMVRESRVSLTMEIEDTGIGIPADKIDKIFDKFTQADTSTTRKYGGTGLGLAITKELVELMGGTIFVSSDVGKGTVFSLSIPFEVATDADLEVLTEKATSKLEVSRSGAEAIPIEDARVLVVEDHPMNQMFVKKLLSSLGCTRFVLAANGKLGVEEIERNDFDVVLMDCHMPEMNGYDATKAIRSMESPLKSKVPIVAMTANAMAEDEQRCLSCGMDAYISKPVDIGIFKQKVGRWINFTKRSDSHDE